MKPFTHHPDIVAKEKMPAREWLLGYFQGAYESSFTPSFASRKMAGIKRRSRASLYKLYKKIQEWK